jgi:hypothetical protein
LTPGKFHLQRLDVVALKMDLTEGFETSAKHNLTPGKYHLQRLDVEALKMDLTEGTETSAKHNLTPGKYPKEHIQYSEHGESLKSRIGMLFI